MAPQKHNYKASSPPQSEGVDIDSLHDGRRWEDGTPRSQNNDFDWNNGSLSIFATVKEKRQKVVEEQ